MLARQQIGFCPQFDALLDNLTGAEHLALFAAIKGVPRADRAALVARQIAALDLAEHAERLATTYSGGNKVLAWHLRGAFPAPLSLSIPTEKVITK